MMKTKSTVRPSETQRISLESGTGGTRRWQSGSWHYSPLRWLDVMKLRHAGDRNNRPESA